MVDILIPYSTHLEILVQTLPYQVKDAFYSHLLRFFLHEYSNCSILIITNKSISIFFQKVIQDFLVPILVLQYITTCRHTQFGQIYMFNVINLQIWTLYNWVMFVWRHKTPVCVKLDIDCLTRVHNLINQIRFYFVTLGGFTED